MLGSVGFGELLLIAIVALVVFGPHRLPEIARKAGQLMAQARKATQELTDALDAEYDGAASPIRDLQSQYEATKRHFTDTTAKVTGSMTSPRSTSETEPENGPSTGSPGGGDDARDPEATDPTDTEGPRGSGTT